MLRKCISSLIVVACLIWNMSLYNVHAASPLNSTSRIEGMLVVDVSNSMKSSDPKNISNEAMKMFIDMASFNGDKIGAIAYADEVMREKALVKIKSEQDKKDLKSFIDSVQKYMYTDLSTGVKEAVNVLDSSHEQGYYPLIVLLADGNNELDPKKSKTEKQAEKDLNQAVAAAKAKGYPIYTIGLNANGKLNKQVLTNVAKSTNGEFFEASSADKLPGILSEIFANHLKLKIVPINQIVGNGDYQDIKINVPNDNVLEANISLMSNHPVEVKLVDPSGKELAIPSDQVLLSKSKTYSMVKLLKPVQGDWTLKVKGVAKDKIDINLVFNYDLQLKLDKLAKQSYKAGETVKIHSFFEDNGTPIADKSIYQSMKSTLYVKDLDQGKTEEVSLSVDDQGFSGQFKLGNSSSYEVLVKAEDNSFFRETQPQKITVQKTAKTPAAAKPANTEDEKPFPWLYVIACVIGALLLAVLAYFLLRKKQGFSGQMVVEVKDEDTGERSNPQYKPLKGFKGKIQLHQLLGLQPEFTETNQIIFKPHAGDSLLLINNSDCTIEKSGRAIDAKKGQQIKRNDRLRIVLKKVNKSIYIEYIS
ncbi:VWA domain-containing protein [Bacillus sp. ISL-40]|uniref:vWA domain-containing protein n=1 Tax=unclassified Bacillus (in: firmicutes) TaxID=185979 RepID=UPI001BEB32BF|nr:MULTISPECIES: vWA domain-containing protein [unclassified Bacillus (in: firmicutes)]MBT2698234.1 VWA domain-containing protein [Bacillus sp. ISL-40]MBT2741943.1 VWA domain-containing protein [Bacillus sp. ISL-77]